MRAFRITASAAIALALAAGLHANAAAQSIDPPSFSGTLSIGESVTIHKTITLAPGGATNVDLFFLGDNTGSMGGIIGQMQSGASSILSALPSTYQFGVGEYNSDPCEAVDGDGNGLADCSGLPTSYFTGPAYGENQALTTDQTAVQTAINGWAASGGGDGPEANFYALQQVANTAGWRSEAQRLVVWFGDAPSHTATTALTDATDALSAANAKVIAFNSTSSGYGIDSGSQASSVVSTVGGSLTNNFTSLTGQAFVDAVNGQIEEATSTLDLIFGSTFSGSGLSLSFTCTDSLGCTDVNAGESRTFDLTVTANEVGSYDFETFAQGIDATEYDHITVVDGEVVPEPMTVVLLGTGLLGLGLFYRRREGEDEMGDLSPS